MVAVEGRGPFPPRDSEPAPVHRRVLVVGDSLVAQSSWEIDRHLTDLGYDAAVSGENGITIGDRVDQIASYIGFNGASVVVVALGTNNAFYSLDGVGATRKVTLDDTRAEVVRVLDLTTKEAPGASFPLSVRCVVWVNATERTTAANTQLAAPQVNAVLRDEVDARAAAGAPVHIADWDAASRDHADWFLPDRLHLDTPGQAAYGSFIADSVRACPA